MMVHNSQGGWKAVFRGACDSLRSRPTHESSDTPPRRLVYLRDWADCSKLSSVMLPPLLDAAHCPSPASLSMDLILGFSPRWDDSKSLASMENSGTASPRAMLQHVCEEAGVSPRLLWSSSSMPPSHQPTDTFAVHQITSCTLDDSSLAGAPSLAAEASRQQKARNMQIHGKLVRELLRECKIDDVGGEVVPLWTPHQHVDAHLITDPLPISQVREAVAEVIESKRLRHRTASGGDSITWQDVQRALEALTRRDERSHARLRHVEKALRRRSDEHETGAVIDARSLLRGAELNAFEKKLLASVVVPCESERFLSSCSYVVTSSRSQHLDEL